ncbi:MAG TPA: LolA-related protein [Nitrospira sp.]|nr:LolA-related protein [Nitrospira sp.]
MTFGKHVINGIASVCLVLGAIVVEAAGPEWTVETLVALLKEQREPSVAFEETTYSSLLTEPLKVRGLLQFTPPATMEKSITDPFHERYVIEGDRVTFESERKGVKRTISLEDYPALRSFVEAFRASFTGDALQLHKVYEVTMDGTRGRWTLLLRPRETTGKSVVDYILFTGSEGRVATIAIRSPDGDRSVMTLLRGAAR